MRIISYGHIKPKMMTCGGCGAVFEYLPRDIEIFTGTRTPKNLVCCPVCGHVTFVNDKLIQHDKYTVFAEDKNE